MAEIREIVLPPGTTCVTVEEAPRRIAEAFSPEEMTVSYLRKVERLPGGLHGPSEQELQSEDWEELRNAWAFLPPYRDGMNRLTWLAYKAAFNLACPHLHWKLQPYWAGGPLSNALDRELVEEEHRGYLRDAIARGELVTRSSAMIPLPAVQGAFPTARIPIADFIAYCAKFDIKVRVAQAETSSLPGVAVRTLAKDLAAQLKRLFGQFWKYRGAYDDLRPDVRTGLDENGILDAISFMSATGQLTFTTESGELVPQFAQFENTFKVSLDGANKIVESIIGGESLSACYRRQELEQDAAGRLTLKHLITFLAKRTGWEFKRWESEVIEAVTTRRLPLRNPRNCTDCLPYAIPAHIDISSEQVSAEDANAWLDSHAEWGVQVRLRTKALMNRPADAQGSAGGAPSGPACDAASNIDWTFWLALREVKAWQAVLLSLGLDPDAEEHSSDSGMEGQQAFLDTKTRGEYGKRLRLLLSNLSDRQHFSAGTLDLVCAADHGVRLREVIAWLIHIKRNPPPPTELARAACPPAGDAPAFIAVNASATTPATRNIDTGSSTEHAIQSRFSKYRWQSPLRNQALELLDKDPNQKLDALAINLVSVAEQMGFKNRSGECLDAATIRRHALYGIHKEHKSRRPK